MLQMFLIYNIHVVGHKTSFYLFSNLDHTAIKQNNNTLQLQEIYLFCYFPSQKTDTF